MARAKAKKTTLAGASSARNTLGKRSPNSRQPRLLGLGPVSLRVLHAAGIATRTDLERLGPVRAFIAAKRMEPRVTLNLLWGIAGALTGTHWTKLPAEYRSSLLLDYDACMDAERSVAALSNKSLERTRER
jgi:DNA transformation protein